MRTERRLPFSARDLCALVGDVEAYPCFIPWIKRIRVLSRQNGPDGWRGNVEVSVGWSGVSTRFTTRVICALDDLRVDIDLVDGPLRTLTSNWQFEQLEHTTRARFRVEFEFKNTVLQGLAYANRRLVSARIIEAFEKEARRRLTP